MSFTEAQQRAIAIAPKFTSVLSVFGSGYIINEVIFRKRRGQSASFYRILLGMSLADLISSATFFFTTWPIPVGSPGVVGARGNMGTCIAQGFFSQLSIATAVYNACLSVYYVLKICNRWPAERIAKQAEPVMHTMAFVIGIGTSLAGVFLNSYNNDIWECWISPLPLDCEESWKHNGETTCIRGDNASLYRWIFYYAPLWTIIVLVTICMFLVYRTVRKQEQATERYDFEHRQRRKHSKQVAIQGYFYCGAFYGTWLFPTVTRLVQVIAGSAPFPLILTTAMFVPIQGFFNWIVYIRPKFLKYCKEKEYLGHIKSSWLSYRSTTIDPTTQHRLSSSALSGHGDGAMRSSNFHVDGGEEAIEESRQLEEQDETIQHCNGPDP